MAGSDNVTELESALRSPAQDRMDPSLPEHSRRLAQIVGVGAKPADEPVVAPPAYGAHHARVRALDPDGEAWIDALNVDPRHRVAAGLGTTVMQREQERVMESAWRQLAAHREAERLRQMAVFARFVGDSLHRRHLQRLDDERAFALTAPAHGRVRSASGDAGTVAGAVHRSILPDATRALAFRRTLRPRGEIAARLGRITGDAGLAFQKQLTVLAKSGLARDYTAPDGTLALAADPRDVFVGAIAEATRLVFAEQGVDEGPAGLEVLSTSIAAEARLASLDASALSALPVPPGLAAELPVTHVPELARAQLTVMPGGLAEQLAFSGFALQREDGATFAAPKDDAGRFVPVEYVGDRFTFLSATGGAVSETTVKGPQRLQDLMLDERTAVRIAGRGSLADASLEFRSVAVAVPIAGLVNPVADVGLFAEVVSPVAEVVSPVADVVSPVAAAFHGVAPWSIGLLEVDEALADQVVVDHGGAASALVKWSAEQSVSLVGTAAALDKLPAHVGADDAGLAAALGAIAGLSSFPAAAAAKPSPFSLATEVAELRMAVEPGRALRKYLANVLEGADEKTAFEPVMWAPTFPDPMWKPLGDVSIEWILAGLERIPPNTVTLAETNGRFVEAFMVGLNHELGREMVWREFPTDQRGTGFARFWGRGVPDIEPIADWSAAPLGKHRPAGDEERLVLVVRGDLLRRYPGTIVFAAPDREGRADFDAAPKLPVFEGRLGAEYRFLGFDMSEKEARDAPWWFVFAEQPSEPRFGLDLPEEAWGGAQTYIPPRAETGEDRELIEAKTWNNAGWHHVVESGHVGARHARAAGGSEPEARRPRGMGNACGGRRSYHLPAARSREPRGDQDAAPSRPRIRRGHAGASRAPPAARAELPESRCLTCANGSRSWALAATRSRPPRTRRSHSSGAGHAPTKPTPRTRRLTSRRSSPHERTTPRCRWRSTRRSPTRSPTSATTSCSVCSIPTCRSCCFRWRSRPASPMSKDGPPTCSCAFSPTRSTSRTMSPS